MRDAEYRQRLGENARRCVLEKFNSEQQAAGFQALFEQAVRR